MGQFKTVILGKLSKKGTCLAVRLCKDRLPLSGEFSKVAEEDDRRLEITGSVCLDRFIVETDLLSASTNTQTKKIQHEMQNLIA